MRPVNLFLTVDGVLKLGYYGLTTQAEFYSIKGEDCGGGYSFAPEVEKGEYETKSDVWSLGIALTIMTGTTPCACYVVDILPRRKGRYVLRFDKDASVPKEVVDFLQKCIQKTEDRSTVSELMDVSVMGLRMMSSIPL